MGFFRGCRPKGAQLEKSVSFLRAANPSESEISNGACLFIKYKSGLYFTELKKISLLIMIFEIFLLFSPKKNLCEKFINDLLQGSFSVTQEGVFSEGGGDARFFSYQILIIFFQFFVMFK
ncbi:hypothetical protein HYU14_06035 [Candidatus Woesearchaeota archaeon]|nr:hypothetical protein [Candidatus Woesearchaeota archaeon]